MRGAESKKQKDDSGAYLQFGHEEKTTKVNLMLLLNFFIESVSLADLVSDILITISLVKSPNTGWAVTTLSAMTAPQLISTNHLI